MKTLASSVAVGPCNGLSASLSLHFVVRCKPLSDASCSELRVRSSLDYDFILIAGFSLHFSSLVLPVGLFRRGEAPRILSPYITPFPHNYPFPCYVCSIRAALVA
jgi:hypothetical protein